MTFYRSTVGLVFAAALTTTLGGCAQLGGNSETITLEEHAQETLRLKGQIADLETRLEDANQANAELREQLAALQEQNTELSERIEMLKVLDQAVEEKRKNYSSN